MKKFVLTIKIILAVALMVSLFAILSSDIWHISYSNPSSPSGNSPNTPSGSTDNSGDNSSDNTEDEHPDDSIPNWSIKSTVVKNTLTDDKGNILCESRYSYPYVTSNDSSYVSSFSDALDKIAADIKNYVSARVQLYKLGTNDNFKVPPQITGYYTINRFSSEIFSISFIFSEILPDGAICENRINYNLDILLDSSDITLDAIMNDAVSAVNGIIATQKGSNKIPTLYSNYEKLVESTINSTWSIQSDGILFFFPAGTIAPTSNGPIEIFIKNSELSSLLSEYGKILLNITK